MPKRAKDYAGLQKRKKKSTSRVEFIRGVWEAGTADGMEIPRIARVYAAGTTFDLFARIRLLAHVVRLQACWLYSERMDVERIINEIESLERLFVAPDKRPLNRSDLSAANRRHDEMLAHSPWFKLWQRYGVCCRQEPRCSD